MPINIIDKLEPKNNAFIGLIDAKQVIGGTNNKIPLSALPDDLSSAGIEDVTYQQLIDNIANSALIPATYYKITDYQTIHYIYDDGIASDVHTSDIEPIIVFATSVNTVDKSAFSTAFPSDIIYYTPFPVNNNLDVANISGNKGAIYYREDVVYNNKFSFDFRNAVVRRWKDSTTNAYCAWKSTDASHTFFTIEDSNDFVDWPFINIVSGADIRNNDFTRKEIPNTISKTVPTCIYLNSIPESIVVTNNTFDIHKGGNATILNTEFSNNVVNGMSNVLLYGEFKNNKIKTLTNCIFRNTTFSENTVNAAGEQLVFNNSTIRNNKFNHYELFYNNTSTGTVIENNIFEKLVSNNDWYSIQVNNNIFYKSFNNLSFYTTQNAIITNNIFEGNVQYSALCDISDCTFSGMVSNSYLENGSSISNCKFQGKFYLNNSSGVTITNSFFGSDFTGNILEGLINEITCYGSFTENTLTETATLQFDVFNIGFTRNEVSGMLSQCEIGNTCDFNNISGWCTALIIDGSVLNSNINYAITNSRITGNFDNNTSTSPANSFSNNSILGSIVDCVFHNSFTYNTMANVNACEFYNFSNNEIIRDIHDVIFNGTFEYNTINCSNFNNNVFDSSLIFSNNQVLCTNFNNNTLAGELKFNNFLNDFTDANITNNVSITYNLFVGRFVSFNSNVNTFDTLIMGNNVLLGDMNNCVFYGVIVKNLFSGEFSGCTINASGGTIVNNTLSGSFADLNLVANYKNIIDNSFSGKITSCIFEPIAADIANNNLSGYFDTCNFNDDLQNNIITSVSNFVLASSPARTHLINPGYTSTLGSAANTTDAKCTYLDGTTNTLQILTA